MHECVVANLFQGGERIRISHFCKKGELVSHRFDDARTLYECFQRGKRESSKCY